MIIVIQETQVEHGSKLNRLLVGQERLEENIVGLRKARFGFARKCLA